MTAPDAELLAVFHDEAVERLDRIVETLLALEAGRAPGRRGGLPVPRRPLHQGECRHGRQRGGARDRPRDGGRARGSAQAGHLLPGPDRSDAPGHRRPAQRGGRRDRAHERRARRALGHDLGQACGEGVPAGAEAAPTSARCASRRTRSTACWTPWARRCFRAGGSTGSWGATRPRSGTMSASRASSGRSEAMLDELQDAVIQLRTLPLSSITAPFPRVVRDLAASQDKQRGARDHRRRDAARPGDPGRHLPADLSSAPQRRGARDRAPRGARAGGQARSRARGAPRRPARQPGGDRGSRRRAWRGAGASPRGAGRRRPRRLAREGGLLDRGRDHGRIRAGGGPRRREGARRVARWSAGGEQQGRRGHDGDDAPAPHPRPAARARRGARRPEVRGAPHQRRRGGHGLRDHVARRPRVHRGPRPVGAARGPGRGDRGRARPSCERVLRR